VSFRSFIDCEIKILYSKNKALENLSGRIIFETKNMLFIEKNGKIKKVPKSGSVFLVKLNTRNIIVCGDFLVNRYVKLKKIIRK